MLQKEPVTVLAVRKLQGGGRPSENQLDQMLEIVE